MTTKLRLIFMGTPAFAVPALEALAAVHEIVAVYCQPPRPAGRGHALQKSPVQLAAERLGIPVETPLSFRKDPAALPTFQNYQADLAVVAAYGLILPQSVLDAPRLGCVNVHGSLLPRWRGAAPMQRAIEAGDAETGICIMRMEAGLDTGPVWRTARLPLTDTTTLPQLHDAMAELGAQEIVAALPAIAAGQTPEPQPEDGVTYAAKVSRDEGRIDWSDSAVTIDRKLRAFTPWPGLFFTAGGKRVKLLAAEVVTAIDATPGTLAGKTIACSDGTALLPLRVQPEGRAAQSWTDFLNGARLVDGTRLG